MPRRRRHLAAGESLLLRGRLHGRVLLPVLWSACLLAAFAGAAVAATPTSWHRPVGVAAVLLWLLLARRRLIRWMTSTLLVTDRRVMFRTGLVRRRGVQVHLDAIGTVRTRRGPLDRLLGAGSITIERFDGEPPLKLRPVRSPATLQATIEAARAGRPADPAATVPPSR